MCAFRCWNPVSACPNQIYSWSGCVVSTRQIVDRTTQRSLSQFNWDLPAYCSIPCEVQVHSEPLGGLSMLSSVLQECLQEVARDPAPGGLPEGQGVKMLLCQDAPDTPAGLWRTMVKVQCCLLAATMPIATNWISFKKEMKQQMDKQTNAKRLKTEDSRQSM